MKRYGRSGWYGERSRHYLAAKGISTSRRAKPKNTMPKDLIQNSAETAKNINITYEKPAEGHAYPISPQDVRNSLGNMSPDSTNGLKGVEFVNPKGMQKDAWAQYTRGPKKVKIFAQPIEEIEQQGPTTMHKRMTEYVLPHEVGHHRALRGGKTDKDLEVAEARADANVVGMDPFDKGVTKVQAIRGQNKRKTYNYTPTYGTGDLAPIATDGIGTAGAAVVPFIPVVVAAGAVYVGAKVAKNQYDKTKGEVKKDGKKKSGK